MKNFSALKCLLAAVAVFIAGCKTDPAPDSGFLDHPELMKEQRGRAPFDRAWVRPGFNKNLYNGVMIPPVNTDYLLQNTGWAAANPASETLEQSARELAAFTRRAFLDAFRDDPHRRFPVVSQPAPGVAVLELAIVELVPSHAILGALGLVAPFARAPIVAVGSKVAGRGTSVAIEGRLRDSMTGEVLMMFADREEPPFRIISVKAITWYGDAEDSIEVWAQQLVELANTPPSHTVRDASNFTLSPW